MKKLLLITTLFVFGCAGIQYKAYKLEDEIIPHTRIDKVLKSENGIHIQRYGVRSTFSDQKTVRTGLYKIVIGNPDNLDKIYWKNRARGFQGVLIYQAENSTDWTVAEYRHYKYRGEPYEDRKLSEQVVKKSNLPRPLNLMPPDLLELVEMAIIYKKRGGIMVIYVLPETSLEDVGKMFGFVVKYGGG